MISASDAALLETTIRREGRSLLQYISEASPLGKAAGDPTPEKIRDLAREERDAVATLTNSWPAGGTRSPISAPSRCRSRR